MRFESPKEAQAYLDHWEARWADTRIHGTTKRQVAAMFAEERPALLGDVAAVTAMLDRILHHGHVLKCGPRSWRTKMAVAAAGDAQ